MKHAQPRSADFELIAAPHAPFDAHGRLQPSQVALQAEALHRHGVSGVFVNGSTGECHSLSVEERLELAGRWLEARDRGLNLRVIVQVGHHCLADAIRLACHARESRADAVATLAPSYFRPPSLRELIEYCEPLAATVAELPFFYYHIPALTGIQLPMDEFLLQAARRIPNLAGIKYSSTDLGELQRCLQVADGTFQIMFGCDEILLAAYALGVRSAVGSSYNFMASLFHELLCDAHQGNWDAAGIKQRTALGIIDLLSEHGYLSASKYVMRLRGIDCGDVRLPLRKLAPQQQVDLLDRLRSLAPFSTPLLPEGIGV